MTDAAQAEPQSASPKSGFAALELDTRLLGMIGAFVVLALAFDLFTDGRFLTPRNIFNLTIQTVSVAIMATGMVFIIVCRHIDLSVGALLATCSASMAMIQTVVLPDWFGLGLGHPMIWILTIVCGVVVGAIVGGLQGWLVGYLAIPAFIVTLGGLLIWRNVGWYLTDGQTIGPLDPTFQMFGGINGTLGVMGSWVAGILAALAAAGAIWTARRRKAAHGFPVKPLWAELTLIGVAVGAIIGFVAVLNSYEIPTRRLQRMFEA
ncbi:MAG: sugar ABC transporter permease, partial [Pseudomonadota bacterium]